MKMLTVKDLSVKLGKFELNGVNFEVGPGEYFVLLGVSGAGKSVLLQIIGGLIPGASGVVMLNGKDISREKVQRRGVGLVFQDAALFPHMNVFKNIAYPLRSLKLNDREIDRRVRELADMTNITKLLKRNPANLSGGEKQRVALARALALKPQCLLLDEPISSLDVQLRRELRSLLRKINANGQTIVHVTHDYEEAALLASRIGVIENGSVVQTGKAPEVFSRPKSEFVANFVGIRNFFRGELRDGKDSMKKFLFDGGEVSVLTGEPEGAGYITVRGEDLIISEKRWESSAANSFPGRVIALEPARVGTEVLVDIGVTLSALVSKESVSNLQLEPGSKVWVSFKASAVKFIPG